jgi:repressor LexA
MSTEDRVLEFVKEYIKENGYPPAYRDIVDAGVVSSTSVADYNLKKLEGRGDITRSPGKARTIVVQGD